MNGHLIALSLNLDWIFHLSIEIDVHYCISFAADDKKFTSLDGLRLHIDTTHLPKRLRCEECNYKTNSATHLKRNAKRQHNIANLHVKRWKHKQQRDWEPRNGKSELVTKFSLSHSFWAQKCDTFLASSPDVLSKEISSSLNLHFGIYQLESDVCQCAEIWN